LKVRSIDRRHSIDHNIKGKRGTPKKGGRGGGRDRDRDRGGGGGRKTIVLFFAGFGAKKRSRGHPATWSGGNPGGRYRELPGPDVS